MTALVRRITHECLALSFVAILAWALFTVGVTRSQLAMEFIATMEAHLF